MTNWKTGGVDRVCFGPNQFCSGLDKSFRQTLVGDIKQKPSIFIELVSLILRLVIFLSTSFKLNSITMSFILILIFLFEFIDKFVRLNRILNLSFK